MAGNRECEAGRAGALRPPPGGEGAENAKTKIKLLRPEEVWQPHRGGRPGNRNALKTGHHTAEIRDLRRRIAAFRRRARAVMADAEDVIAGYKHHAREAREAASAPPHPRNPPIASESEGMPLAPVRP